MDSFAIEQQVETARQVFAQLPQYGLFADRLEALLEDVLRAGQGVVARPLPDASAIAQQVEQARKIIAQLPQYELVRDRQEEWIARVLEADPTRIVWHAKRLGGFGGSEIGVLVANANGERDDFGDPTESSAYGFVRNKLMLDAPVMSSGVLERGGVMEPIIQKIFHKTYHATTDEDAMRVLAAAQGVRPWMRYSPDEIVRIGALALRYLADFKAPTTPKVSAQETISFRYACQLSMGKMVGSTAGLKFDGGLLLVQFDWQNWAVVVNRVADDPVRDRLIIEAGDYYWNDFVLKGEVPPLIERAEVDLTDEALRKEMDYHLERFSIAKSMESAAKKRAEAEQLAVKALLAGQRIPDGAMDKVSGVSVAVQNALDVERALVELGADARRAARPGMAFDTEAMARALLAMGGNPEAYKKPVYDEGVLRQLLAERGFPETEFERPEFRFNRSPHDTTNKELSRLSAAWCEQRLEEIGPRAAAGLDEVQSAGGTSQEPDPPVRAAMAA